MRHAGPPHQRPWGPPRACRLDELRQLLTSLWAQAGLPVVQAGQLTEHLLENDRRGHSSHGCWQAERYFRSFVEGRTSPEAIPVAQRLSSTQASVDGNGGHGVFALELACRTAIEVAAAQGMGLCTSSGHSHVGSLGPYLEKATENGLAAIACCGRRFERSFLDPSKPVHESARQWPPLGIAFPGRDAAFVLDMGTQLPWDSGVAARIPAVYLRAFGLAHAVNLLAGLAEGPDRSSQFADATDQALFLALRPGSLARLQAEVAELMAAVPKMIPQPGFRSALPGQLEWERRSRCVESVELHESTRLMLDRLLRSGESPWVFP